jgi:hypothetical protein
MDVIIMPYMEIPVNQSYQMGYTGSNIIDLRFYLQDKVLEKHPEAIINSFRQIPIFFLKKGTANYRYDLDIKTSTYQKN